MLKDVDFFGSASSFVSIAEKIAFRNERNKVWIFCSTGRASNDSLGVFRFGFSFVAVLTDRVVYSDYSSHLFWNREKTSKINGARSSDEAMKLVKATCEFLDADLNEWVRVW